MTTVPRTENLSLGENCIFMKSFSLKPRYILLNSITIAKSDDHAATICKKFTMVFGAHMNIAKPVPIRNTINITELKITKDNNGRFNGFFSLIFIHTFNIILSELYYYLNLRSSDRRLIFRYQTTCQIVK